MGEECFCAVKMCYSYAVVVTAPASLILALSILFDVVDSVVAAAAAAVGVDDDTLLSPIFLHIFDISTGSFFSILTSVLSSTSIQSAISKGVVSWIYFFLVFYNVASSPRKCGALASPKVHAGRRV